MKPKVIKLHLLPYYDNMDKRLMWELKRDSDNRRECLPFKSSKEAIEWAKATMLNNTVYKIVIG